MPFITWLLRGTTAQGDRQMMQQSQQARLWESKQARQRQGRALLTDVRALRGTRVHRDDHSPLEDEAQRRGAVVGLDILHHLPLKRVDLQRKQRKARRTAASRTKAKQSRSARAGAASNYGPSSAVSSTSRLVDGPRGKQLSLQCCCGHPSRRPPPMAALSRQAPTLSSRPAHILHRW